MSLMEICDALRDLVPFDQFKKREKYSWRSVTFSKKVTLPMVSFSRFLNYINGIKSRKSVSYGSYMQLLKLKQSVL